MGMTGLIHRARADLLRERGGVGVLVLPSTDSQEFEICEQYGELKWLFVSKHPTGLVQQDVSFVPWEVRPLDLTSLQLHNFSVDPVMTVKSNLYRYCRISLLTKAHIWFAICVS